MKIVSNFPKIHCPFVRKEFLINREHWDSYGNKLKLRKPQVYLVVDEINPGYEWVFNDPKTFVCEKLDGTNIKIYTEGGRLLEVRNRKNIIDPLQIIKGKTFIPEGIFRAVGKGYVEMDGEQAGELIGPKIQGNPYKLNNHIWYPFSKAIKHLTYKSFHEHERTFDNWSIWFKDWLFSRFYSKRNSDDKVMAEGIVFYNLKRKQEGKTYMAKLRRDMFEWFYSDKIEIYNYHK